MWVFSAGNLSRDQVGHQHFSHIAQHRDQWLRGLGLGFTASKETFLSLKAELKSHLDCWVSLVCPTQAAVSFFG